MIQSKLRSGIETGLAFMFVMALPFLLCGVLLNWLDARLVWEARQGLLGRS